MVVCLWILFVVLNSSHETGVTTQVILTVYVLQWYIIRWPRHTWGKWLQMYTVNISLMNMQAKDWVNSFLVLRDWCEGFQQHPITPYIHIRSTMCPPCYRGLALSSSSQDKVGNDKASMHTFFESNDFIDCKSTPVCHTISAVQQNSGFMLL